MHRGQPPRPPGATGEKATGSDAGVRDEDGAPADGGSVDPKAEGDGITAQARPSRGGEGSRRRPPAKAAATSGTPTEPRAAGAAVAASGAAAAPAPEPSVGAEVDPGLQRHWQEVVSELQRKQTARFFRLAYSEVVALRDDTLQVAVTSQAAAEELNRNDTRRLIEQALAAEMGRPMRFEPIAGKGGAGQPGKAADSAQSIDRQAREDPVVRLSMEVLDGTFEGVVARSRRDGA